MEKTTNRENETTHVNKSNRTSLSINNGKNQSNNNLSSYNNVGFYESNHSSSKNNLRNENLTNSSQTFNPDKILAKKEKIERKATEQEKKNNVNQKESRYSNISRKDLRNDNTSRKELGNSNTFRSELRSNKDNNHQELRNNTKRLKSNVNTIQQGSIKENKMFPNIRKQLVIKATNNYRNTSSNIIKINNRAFTYEFNSFYPNSVKERILNNVNIKDDNASKQINSKTNNDIKNRNNTEYNYGKSNQVQKKEIVQKDAKIILNDKSKFKFNPKIQLDLSKYTKKKKSSSKSKPKHSYNISEKINITLNKDDKPVKNQNMKNNKKEDTKKIIQNSSDKKNTINTNMKKIDGNESNVFSAIKTTNDNVILLSNKVDQFITEQREINKNLNDFVANQDKTNELLIQMINNSKK